MKILNFLRSKKFGLWLAIITVLVQAAHSTYVFLSLSSFGELWALIHSAVMAIVISGAILFFTLRKKITLAIFFAAFESAINIAYYVKYIIVENQSWWLLAIALPVAVVLPLTLYYYSEELTEEDIEEKKLKNKVSLKLVSLDQEAKVYNFETVENGRMENSNKQSARR